MDSSQKVTKDVPSPNEAFEDGEDLELRGLLSGVQTVRGKSDQMRDPESKHYLSKWLGFGLHGSEAEEEGRSWSRKRVVTAAVVLILILLGAALAPPLVRSGGRKGPASKSHPNSKFVGTELRSNGTHDFRRTVLIVSIDGLR